MYYGEIPPKLSRNTTFWNAPLKCMYSKRSMGNKQNELEKCLYLQGYDVIGIIETLWDP